MHRFFDGRQGRATLSGGDASARAAFRSDGAGGIGSGRAGEGDEGAILDVPSRRGVVAAAGALILAGCQTSERQAPPPSRYAAEPHEVRIVDRSKFDPRLRPTMVTAPVNAPRGSILVETGQHHLFLMEGDGQARRYGIAVGATGHAWSGTARIGRKAKWPNWYPTDEMRRETPGIPRMIPGGAANPLGARALYLYQGGRDTLYRIHGTTEPWGIGTDVSSGCIRMINEDAIDLFDRVAIGAQVIVR